MYGLLHTWPRVGTASRTHWLHFKSGVEIRGPKDYINIFIEVGYVRSHEVEPICNRRCGVRLPTCSYGGSHLNVRATTVNMAAEQCVYICWTTLHNV
jgi:hypothetical protein